MILRTRHLESLKRQLANFPVAAILGARQVGKTTLVRQLEGRIRRIALTVMAKVQTPDDETRRDRFQEDICA